MNAHAFNEKHLVKHTAIGLCAQIDVSGRSLRLTTSWIFSVESL